MDIENIGQALAEIGQQLAGGLRIGPVAAIEEEQSWLWIGQQIKSIGTRLESQKKRLGPTGPPLAQGLLGSRPRQENLDVSSSTGERVR